MVLKRVNVYHVRRCSVLLEIESNNWCWKIKSKSFFSMLKILRFYFKFSSSLHIAIHLQINDWPSTLWLFSVLALLMSRKKLYVDEIIKKFCEVLLGFPAIIGTLEICIFCYQFDFKINTQPVWIFERPP